MERGTPSTAGESPADTGRRPWLLRLVVSIVLGGALLALLAGNVDLIPTRLEVQPLPLAGAIALTVAFAVARSLRWHFLVRPFAETDVRTSTLASLAGFMWIMLLPLRLGELARPLFLSHKLAERRAVPLTRLLASVGLERVVDGLVVCGLFFLSVTLRAAELQAGDNAGHLQWLIGVGSTVALFLLAVLVTLLAMALSPTVVGRLVSWPLRRVSTGLADKVESLAREIAEGLAALPTLGPLASFLGVTLVYWGCNAMSMWLLARACGLDLSPWDAVAVMSVLGLAILVPGGPAQLGNFQLGVTFGLGLFLSAEAVQALGSAYVFLLYVVQLCIIVSLGALAQWALALDWRLIFRPAPPGDEPAPEST